MFAYFKTNMYAIIIIKIHTYLYLRSFTRTLRVATKHTLAYIFKYLHMYMNIRTYAHTQNHVHACVCTYLCLRSSARTFGATTTYTHIYTSNKYICIYMNMHSSIIMRINTYGTQIYTSKPLSMIVCKDIKSYSYIYIHIYT